MSNQRNEAIGYACAYTPLVLLYAAKYRPYRVLPRTESQDQAGLHLHDNLCPHVKRILDRAMGGDLPELKAMVFMNSCDAMRRLSDAWAKVRGHDRTILVDLPSISDSHAVRFFAEELRRLGRSLRQWSGNPLTDDLIREGIHEYNRLSRALSTLAARVHKEGGQASLQEAYIKAATEPLPDAIRFVDGLLSGDMPAKAAGQSSAIFLFGNILPDRDAFDLFEACGVHIADEDLCTGSRMFQPIEIPEGEDLYLGLSRAILTRKPCARTFDPARPGQIAFDMIESAKACNAAGAICHTAKFCDPYLARLPFIREVFRKEGMPLLVLEGDCTMRSMGQHRTRIEAFIEMLG
ncbi:MAG: 2-hydroxyacyl-CoA dehydratase family protein [Desulfomonilia bacterium]|jgi:benzoyl-CoA reductase/2-hydroxyglutaryl-CoA dehydratase subunit BcrC/BadD/HgdB